MKIQELIHLATLIIIVCLSLFFGFNSASAKVTGTCANCHTMHNSQGGTDVISDAIETLLANDCVGCHSSTTSSTTYSLGGSTVPVVHYTGGSAPTEYLAGGNFWWVKEGLGADDSKGHNVFLNENDEALIAGAPGGFNCSSSCCHTNLSQPSDSPGWGEGFTDRYGCQGCHLYVRHHASDHDSGKGLVTTGDQGWYRFLAHHTNNNGVHGYEDNDWEAGQPNLVIGTDGTTDHNEYLGDAAAGMGLSSNNTTTGFCTGCHGDFHLQTDSGSWIRHPSDAYLPGDAQYGAYTLYDPLAPVARKTLTDPPTPGVTANGVTDMVMCLSCHRPHGSPYSDLLRWDYDAMIAGGGGAVGTGCFVCHTNKDGS